MTSGPAIRCVGLVKRFADVLAVDGLDLEVERGECFGLLGPNGAGKTTTVEIMEGLLPPDGGTVEVLGTAWGGWGDRKLRERLGVALQETRLPDKLTVEETVRLFRSFYARGRSVDEVISLLGLTEKRRSWVSKLSGGQRQRLALATALVGAPDVLFLDEPTTGLDPQARLAIWQVIEDFRRAGGTVLLTTHYMEEAERLCDRVAILDSGRSIVMNSPSGLIELLGAGQVVELTGAGLTRDLLETLDGVEGVVPRGALFTLRLPGGSEKLAGLLAALSERGLAADSVTTRRPTLEDVYVHLTGRGLRDA